MLTPELALLRCDYLSLGLLLWGNAGNVLQRGQNLRIEAVEVGPWIAGTVNPAKVVQCGANL